LVARGGSAIAPGARDESGAHVKRNCTALPSERKCGRPHDMAATTFRERVADGTFSGLAFPRRSGSRTGRALQPLRPKWCRNPACSSRWPRPSSLSPVGLRTPHHMPSPRDSSCIWRSSAQNPNRRHPAPPQERLHRTPNRPCSTLRGHLC
jgi:hypothetical protein